MQDESLGEIQGDVPDIGKGRIRGAVLASGSFLSVGERLSAVPWRAPKLPAENKRSTLDADVGLLKHAPDFNMDEWPIMAEVSWNMSVEPHCAK